MTRIQKVALAYLLGAYLSDGSLELSGSGSLSPRWGVTDKPFIGCIRAALGLIGVRYSESIEKRGFGPMGTFGGWKRPRFRKDLRCLRTLQPEAGELGEWFDEVSPDKYCLPSIPRELVRPFVAGLMDGDGSISKNFQLRFTGSEGFVHDFKDLLEDEKVRVGKDQIKNKTRKEWKTCYQWSINLKDFLAAGLRFAMPRKQELLARWCFRTIKSSRPDSHKSAIAQWWLYEVYDQLMECISEDRSPSDGRYYVARLAGRRTFQEVQQHEADHFGFKSSF